MNRILFESQSDRYQLPISDPRFEHVRGVLRMGVGDSFDVGVANGPVGKGLIESLDGENLTVSVEWGACPSPPPPVHLVVGMCRPATARKILTTAPTLGVRSLCFAASGRSDPAYARASLWTGDEWRARLFDGVEQAFDTYVPPLEAGVSLADAVNALPREGVRLALDVYEGTRPLTSVQLGEDSPVCLAIGPERGWNKNDRQLLLEAGFELVSLNERVLRVETAVTVGLTLVLSAMGVY